MEKKIVSLEDLARLPIDEALWKTLASAEIKAENEAEKLLRDAVVSLASVRQRLAVYGSKYISEAHETVLARIVTLGDLCVLPAREAQSRIAALKEERRRREQAVWSLLQVGEADVAQTLAGKFGLNLEEIRSKYEATATATHAPRARGDNSSNGGNSNYKVRYSYTKNGRTYQGNCRSASELFKPLRALGAVSGDSLSAEEVRNLLPGVAKVFSGEEARKVYAIAGVEFTVERISS